MEAYGPPEVLSYVETNLQPLGPREVRIRTIAAAVNHTDLQIRRGNWTIRSANPFPYVPGVEVVGTITETGLGVSDWAVGQPVITMMQGLGGVRAARPGAYADFVTVDFDTLAAIPSSLDPVAMAALGLVGVTAYEGLRRLGSLENRRVLVTGAAGGVGSAAIAIAKAQGASVLGLVSSQEDSAYVRQLGADDVHTVARDRSPDLKAESVDGILDAVAGNAFGSCLNALRAGGVLSLVGAIGGSDVSFDAWTLIRPVIVTGYSTELLDGPALRNAIHHLSGWLNDGTVRAPAHKSLPLYEASKAHRYLEQGGVRGRILLRPFQRH
jgi:NADPH2:quinone reductase